MTWTRLLACSAKIKSNCPRPKLRRSSPKWTRTRTGRLTSPSFQKLVHNGHVVGLHGMVEAVEIVLVSNGQERREDVRGFCSGDYASNIPQGVGVTSRSHHERRAAGRINLTQITRSCRITKQRGSNEMLNCTRIGAWVYQASRRIDSVRACGQWVFPWGPHQTG